MDTFRTIRVKTGTAAHFREFSKHLFKTHTEALQTMLDFFFYNEISPKERFGPTGRTLENLIKKRFSAMAAIMKELDKHGITPTRAMMELLFEHAPQQNKQQKSSSSNKQNMPVKDDAFFKLAFESIEMQKQNTILRQNLDKIRQRFIETLDKVEINKSRFGQTKLQLNMTLEEYNNLESTLKQSRHCTY